MPNQLEGKTFMFTGTLSVPRHEAQELVEELGGISGSSVTRNTDYLVCGSDQVGISDKWMKAGLLGVTRVDEDYFWSMVKEAREGTEDYSGLVGIITEETLKNVLDILEAKKPTKVEEKYPPVESMSYYSKEQLETSLRGISTSPTLSSRICPYCSNEIPYSINSTYWFCFKCSLFSNVGQEKGRHVCVDWEKFLDTELGFYENCKVCGNVEFVAHSEVEENVKFDVKRNYHHSLEFVAEVASIYVDIDKRPSIAAKLSDSEREELYAKFTAREKRREAKLEEQQETSSSQFGE